MDRAAALARYRMGAPLPFEELRFARRDSAGAGRVGVLGARGSPESTAAARPPVAEVERSVRVGAFPQTLRCGQRWRPSYCPR